MSESPLTPELIKRCNPGLSDFGSGTILALSGQCLRSAKQPSDCRECLEACPVGALEVEAMTKPHVNTDCLRCGYCVQVCPLNALAATTRTIQQLVRTLLQATLRVDELTITCQRSLALLRLEAESSEPQAALASLELVNQAQESENLFLVPCLAMLSRELWFTVLNEIGVARIRRLYVWLPVEQCGQCPVDGLSQVEMSLDQAIGTAERWSGQAVQIITTAEELPQYRKAGVRRYLASAAEVDRRGVFTGFVDELRRTWDDSSRTGNRAADETLRFKERKEAVNRTLLATDLRAQLPGVDKQVVTPFRQALVEAIGRNPANAPLVELLVSQTDAAACDGCGACVDVCPLHARRLLPRPESDEPVDKDGLAVDDRTASADPLYCLGCSACLQACPQQACSFTLISGEAFLR